MSALTLFVFVSIVILFILSVRAMLSFQIKRVFASMLGMGICLILALIGTVTLLFDIGAQAEQIGEVDVIKLDKQLYSVELHLNDLPRLSYEIKGDQWQLDTRLLVWSRRWELLGFDTLYQFDRLSGRYNSLIDERTRDRTVYSLSPVEEFNDVSNAILKFVQQGYFPGMEAYYGSGVFVPAVDKGRYGLFLYPKGLQIRPLNKAARESLEEWD